MKRKPGAIRRHKIDPVRLSAPIMFNHPFNESVLVSAVLPTGLSVEVIGAECVLAHGGRHRQHHPQPALRGCRSHHA